MRLKEYLDKYRIEPIEFAVKCNLSPASVYRYLNDEPMRRTTAKKIEKYTKGEVSYEELMKLNEKNA